MLFFNNTAKGAHLSELAEAFRSLIARGLVLQEAHGNAYSLTVSGFRAAIAASRQQQPQTRTAEAARQVGPQRRLTEAESKAPLTAAKKTTQQTGKVRSQLERRSAARRRR